MDSDTLQSLVAPASLAAFHAFCGGPLTTILAEETTVLGGAAPPRRRTDSRTSLAGAGFSSSPGTVLHRSSSAGLPSTVADLQTGSSSSGRPRCALVASPSAHRFGFVAQPPPDACTKRSSRLDSVFAFDDGCEVGDEKDQLVSCGSGGSGSTGIDGVVNGGGANSIESTPIRGKLGPSRCTSKGDVCWGGIDVVVSGSDDDLFKEDDGDGEDGGDGDDVGFACAVAVASKSE
jgi:hypothetical protein